MELKDVLDLGLTGVLAVAVMALWQRLNDVTDIIIKNNAQSSKERKKIAQAVNAPMTDSRTDIPVQKG